MKIVDKAYQIAKMNIQGTKDEVIETIIRSYCPSDFKLDDDYAECGATYGCEHCWNRESKEEKTIDKNEKVLLERIDSNENLSESEISEVVNEYEIERKVKYGLSDRIYKTFVSISKIGDRYFSTEWKQSLDIDHYNRYDNQPVEVQKVTHKKLITVTEWEEVKSRNGGWNL